MEAEPCEAGDRTMPGNEAEVLLKAPSPFARFPYETTFLINGEVAYLARFSNRNFNFFEILDAKGEVVASGSYRSAAARKDWSYYFIQLAHSDGFALFQSKPWSPKWRLRTYLYTVEITARQYTNPQLSLPDARLQYLRHGFWKNRDMQLLLSRESIMRQHLVPMIAAMYVLFAFECWVYSA